MELIHLPVDLSFLMDLGYLLDPVDPWKKNAEMSDTVIDPSFLKSLIKIPKLGLLFQSPVDNDFKVT